MKQIFSKKKKGKIEISINLPDRQNNGTAKINM